MPIWPFLLPRNITACCHLRYLLGSGCNSITYHSDSAPRVFKGNQANSAVSQTTWSPANNSFGWFASGSTRQFTTNKEPLHSTMAFHCSGFCVQSPQEHSPSTTVNGVLRLHHRHSNNDHHPSTSQDGSHTEGSLTYSRIWVNPDKNPIMYYWHIFSHQASSSSGSPSFLALAGPEESGPIALSDVMDTTVSESRDRFTVVENSVIHTPFQTNLEAQSFNSDRNRCLQGGFGGRVCHRTKTGGRWHRKKVTFPDQKSAWKCIGNVSVEFTIQNLE